MPDKTVAGPSGTLYQASDTYDAGAQVKAVSSTTNPLLNLSFSYDSLGRLTSVSGGQSQSFTYDAVGNIAWNSQVGSHAYASTAHRHAVSSAGGQGYSYDAAGNMLSDGGRAYTWNYDHQLVSVSGAGGTTHFVYDYSGQRVHKSGPSGTHSYFGAFVELRDGVLVKNYYAGPNRVASRDASGPRWFHSDHLGSVRLATSASGAVLERYDYEAPHHALALAALRGVEVRRDFVRAAGTGVSPVGDALGRARWRWWSCSPSGPTSPLSSPGRARWPWWCWELRPSELIIAFSQLEGARLGSHALVMRDEVLVFLGKPYTPLMLEQLELMGIDWTRLFPEIGLPLNRHGRLPPHQLAIPPVWGIGS